MNILFAKVANPLDSADYFNFLRGSFSYNIEVKEDHICIKDTCDRMIPFDVTEVPDLITALEAYMQYVGDAVLDNMQAQELLDEEVIITVD